MNAVSILIVVLGAYLAMEAACLLALRILHKRTCIYYNPKNRPRLSAKCRAFIERLIAEKGLGDAMEFNAVLGWTLRAGILSKDGLYRTNRAGARASREYPPAPEPGRIRVTTFGDCLTYGEAVLEEDTWQRRMERLDARLELINMGVEGYGPAQMYLRYLESLVSYRRQDVVVMAMATTNVFKPLNAFRPFYAYDHGLMLAKPRFQLREGKLRYIENPLSSLFAYQRLLERPDVELRRLGEIDHYQRATYRFGVGDMLPSIRLIKILRNSYRRLRDVMDRRGRYVKGSEALRTTTAIMDEFCMEVRRRGAVPLIILFPLRADIQRFAKNGTKPWEPLAKHFQSKGFAHVDILEAFGGVARADGVDRLVEGRRYSDLGNQIIAESVVRRIDSLIGTGHVGEPSEQDRAAVPP